MYILLNSQILCKDLHNLETSMRIPSGVLNLHEGRPGSWPANSGKCANEGREVDGEFGRSFTHDDRMTEEDALLFLA